jgi:hypothetical protein
MRKSFDSLHALVTGRLGEDPRSGEVFMFANRTRNRIKLLHRNLGDGFWTALIALGRTRQFMKVRWSEIDWSLTNTEIVCLTCRALGTVRNQRSKHAPGTKGELHRSNGIDWSVVDWSLPDEALSQIHSRTCRTVRFYRRKQNPSLFINPLKNLWENIDWSFSNIQIARFLGVSRQAVHARRMRAESSKAEQS